MTYLRISGLVLVVFLIGLIGWGIRDLSADAQIASLEAAAAKEKAALAEAHAQAVAAVLERSTQLQEEAQQRDQTHTTALTESLDENRRLRTDLLASERLRLRGATCRTPTGDAAPGPGLGDGEAIELSGATRLAVFDLREALIRDRAKLRYLQEERRTLTCEPQKSPG